VEGDGHSDEHQTHGYSRQHEHVTSLESDDDECSDHGTEQTPVGVGEIDPRLGVGARVAHHLIEQILVVGEKRVTGHLGEETHHGGDEDTASHTGCADHIEPRLLAVADFNQDGFFDLG